MHFVPVDDGGGAEWGGPDILNRNFKAQTCHFFVVLLLKECDSEHKHEIVIEN